MISTRTAALALNSIVVVFFSCFSAYTFFARSHLDSLARDFVTRKTVGYATPIVEITSESLDSPLAKKLLSKDQALAIRDEIRDYRNDPVAYVSDLTNKHVRRLPLPNANPLLAKVASIKEKIRNFYDDTLNALITDLRIFSVSNLIAGMIAFGLAYGSSHRLRKSIVWFSLLNFVAVLFCSYFYFDHLTFFRILFQSHMGWAYAVLLGVVTFALYRTYSQHAAAIDQSDIKEPADRADPNGQSAAAGSASPN